MLPLVLLVLFFTAKLDIENCPKYIVPFPELLIEHLEVGVKLKYLDQDISDYYYESVIPKGVPDLDNSTQEEIFKYELTLVISMFVLNRMDERTCYNVAMTMPKDYLASFPDSIAVKDGGELRSYLLYNHAYATYYTSYVRGLIQNTQRRQQARKIYGGILETYPESYVSDFTKLALAWFILESGKGYFADAVEEFNEIIKKTENPDVKTLAAYGNGLAYYYSEDYENALEWFLDEEGYKSLGIVTVIGEASTEILYSPAADSVIAHVLYWRGICLEELSRDADALDVYYHIAYTYPDFPEAGDAWQKIVEMNIENNQIDKAIEAVESMEERMPLNPRIYTPAYGYGLAQLYRYYFEADDEAEAQRYAKKLQQELGTTDLIDIYIYGEEKEPSLSHLSKTIEKIRARNPYSKYLPDPMFLSTVLLIEDEQYQEAEKILLELKNWPDPIAVMHRLPEISYQLARIYFNREDYIECVKELVWWRSHFEEGKDARIDLAPFIHYFLGLSYLNLGDIETLSEMKKDYYAKALVNFGIIKDQYEDSDLYYDNSEKIIQYIEECEKKIAGVE